MVVAADFWSQFVIELWNNVAAPLLGSAAEPLRQTLFIVIPKIVGGSLGGAGFGMERILF